MTADHDHGDDASNEDVPGTSHDPDAHEGGEEGRVTAPMQSFSMGQVGTGFVVLVVGVAVGYVLPFLV